MISYLEALDILRRAEPFAPVQSPLLAATGQVSAQNVTSNVSVPPFDNSAMDGFAVRSADTLDAKEDNPVILPVSGSTVAGDQPSGGTVGAWEIMTGAPVPEAYDAVVKIEDVTITAQDVQGRPATICLTRPVPTRNNIRRAGEDISPGDAILKTGTVITPHHIMALATIGCASISVARKPDITVFSTGKEIIDDVEASLQPGQIRNSNGPYLMAALAALPVHAKYGGVIADEPDVFEARMADVLIQSDLIISTGAVSAGRHDFIPDSLRKLGAKIHFHKVGIRPGKPILYARFPDGTHYFGLPGNPVSAAVGLRFFAMPLLRHLQGLGKEMPVRANLTAPYRKKPGLRFFAKAHLATTEDGQLQVEILHGQESFKIQPLLKANGWAVLPETISDVDAGTMVDVFPLIPEYWLLGGR